MRRYNHGFVLGVTLAFFSSSLYAEVAINSIDPENSASIRSAESSTTSHNDCSTDCPDMIFIDGGKLEKVKNSSTIPSYFESYTRNIDVKSFMVSRTPITVAQLLKIVDPDQYKSLCLNDKCDMPFVGSVDYIEGFLKEIKIKTGKEYRLISDDEYQFLLESNKKILNQSKVSEDERYSGLDFPFSIDIYNGSSVSQYTVLSDDNKMLAEPASEFRSNIKIDPLGTVDLLGNVRILTSSCLSKRNMSIVRDHKTECDPYYKVVVGLSFHSTPDEAYSYRSWKRSIVDTTHYFDDIGFRVVRDVTPEEIFYWGKKHTK